MLYVHLLGGLTLQWLEEPPLIVETTQARALLAYLILHKDTLHNRAVLAGTFWPDLPEEQAQRRLRQALWHISRQLDRLPQHPYLLRVGGEIGFNTDLPHWIDVCAFEHLQQGTPEEMAQALQLYRGPLLPEVFTDWVQLERERLHGRWLTLLERLALAHQAQDDLLAATETARVLINASPWHEPAARLLMRLLADQGRASEAVHAYYDLRSHLESDLGVRPDRQTIALYRQIQAACPRTPAAAPAPAPAPNLVGRNDELAALETALQSGLQGQGQLVFLTGSAGVGKTHLAQAVVAAAQDTGFVAVYGRAVEPFGAPAPYSPLDQAMRAILTSDEPGFHLPALTVRLSALARAALSVFLPDVVRIPTGIDVTRLEPSHFCSALTSALVTLTGPGPTLLVLEDLHWADPATWTVLNTLLPRLAGCRLVVLATFRSTDVSPAVAAWLNRLCAHPAVRSVALAALSPEETARLTAQLAACTPPPQLCARLHAETGGNPLFLVETVRNLVERGSFRAVPGGQPCGSLAGDLPIPVSLQQAILARLAALTPQTQYLLRQLAVLDDGFSFDLVHALSGDEEEHVLLEELDELLARGLLVEEQERYRFAHNLVRRVLYDDMPPRRKKLWHQQAAEALARLEPRQVPARARHAFAAGNWPQALELSLLAAEKALDLLAVEEALAFYRRAQEAEENAGCGPSAHSLQRLRGMAQAHRLQGNDQAEVHDLTEWRAAARNLGDTEGEALALAALADNLRRRGLSEDALPLAQEGHRLAGDSAAALAATSGALGACYHAMGDPLQAQVFYEQAVEAARRAHDVRQEAQYLHSLAVIQYRNGAVETAIQLYERVAAMAAGAGDRLLEGRALYNLATVRSSHSQIQHTYWAYERVLSTLKALEVPDPLLGIVQRGLAQLWIVWGYVDRARPHLSDALALFTHLDRPDGRAVVLLELARLALVADQPTEALAYLKQAEQSLPRQGQQQEHVFFHHCAVEVQLHAGQLAAAAKSAARLSAMVAEASMNWFEGSALLQISRVEAAQGNLDRAEDLVRRAVHLLEQQGIRPNIANAYTELGLILHLQGREEEARRHLSAGWYESVLFMMQPALSDAVRRLGHLPELAGQQTVELPRQGAPLRRELAPEERTRILWTPDAGPWEPDLPPVPLRQSRIRRLLTEAAVQGASPGIPDLAQALGVSFATLKADLAALRREGWPVFTRGHFPVGSVPS